MATDAENLEREAVEARRRADIAKHVPMTEQEYAAIEGEQAAAAKRAIPLFKHAITLNNDFANELSRAGILVNRLRAEALYWKQKAQDKL